MTTPRSASGNIKKVFQHQPVRLKYVHPNALEACQAQLLSINRFRLFSSDVSMFLVLGEASLRNALSFRGAAAPHYAWPPLLFSGVICSDGRSNGHGCMYVSKSFCSWK